MNHRTGRITLKKRNSSPAHGEKVRLPRILLVLTEFPPKIGGMQTHAIYLSRHLAGHGYRIEVVTYHPEDDEEKQAVRDFDAGLEFPVRRVLSRIGFWNNIAILESVGNRFQPDLVYTSTVFYGYIAPVLGVPVFSRSVGNDILRPWIAYPYRFGSRFLSSPWLERRLYNFFKNMEKPEWLDGIFIRKRRSMMEEAVRKATRIFANSDFTSRLLQDMGLPGERVEVTVGGVDAGRFAFKGRDKNSLRAKLGLPCKGYVIVTVCRLVKKKGVDFLLETFRRLREKMPDAHLVIIGEGPMERRYRMLAETLGVTENVTFTGRITHDAIHEHYWCGDVFVLASNIYVHPRWGIRDAETMGRVLCEANAASLPVIASCCGGIPSVISHEKNGLLFEPNNQPELIRCIMRIRQSKSLEKKLVCGGLNAANRLFDWSVVMKSHERAFAEILR